MDGRQGARVSWRCSRHIYRAREGLVRRLAGGTGRDAMATVSCIRARILTSSDRLRREEYREGIWNLLWRPGRPYRRRGSWPTGFAALSTPGKTTVLLFFSRTIFKAGETVSGFGLGRVWAVLACFGWCGVGLRRRGKPGKPPSLCFLFSFLFSVFIF